MGFLISILFGKFIGNKGSYIFTNLTTISSFLISIVLMFQFIKSSNLIVINLINWFNISFLVVDWSFRFDTLTIIMLITILSISSCAHLYSIDYMKHDPHHSRFMAYLSLFTFFMLCLVTSNNLVQLFLGWEGVGICSYLLINFWYTRYQANKAALKAMFVNKISDLALLIGIVQIYFIFKSINFGLILPSAYLILNSNYYSISNNLMFVCLFLILVGAMGKSAQIGLHIWLPDAMEGPTPVSSLIHAATMVTAGVFLIVRLSHLFELFATNQFIILFVGTLTAFFSSSIGVFQNDLKKVIAYSTCSQIGYMFFACGYSGYSMAMYHLFNHAFFKALLFLTAGSIIHSVFSEQDIRRMGGLIKVLPFSYMSFSIGSLSLTGFLFFSGFYSKDSILETAYYSFSNNYFELSHSFYWITTHAIVFTCIYSSKLLYFVFFSYFKGYKLVLSNIHDSPKFIIIPLIFLSFLSIFLGYMTKDLMIGLGTDFWGNSIYNINSIDSEFNSISIKLIPFIISIYSILVSTVLWHLIPSFSLNSLYYNSYLYDVFLFLNKKWGFDKLISNYVSTLAFTKSYDFVNANVDKGFLEFFGSYGLSLYIKTLSSLYGKLETHYLYHYLGYFINIFLILFYVFLIYSYIIYI